MNFSLLSFFLLCFLSDFLMLWDLFQRTERNSGAHLEVSYESTPSLSIPYSPPAKQSVTEQKNLQIWWLEVAYLEV